MGCDVSIRVGGQAGQGMNVISALLGKCFTRQGLFVFINQDVMSRIRGGHNFTQIRVSDKQVSAVSSDVDILVCLDKNTLDIYRDKVGKIIIYDSGKIKESIPEGEQYIAIPLEEIAKNIGGDARMSNVVASGALLNLLGMPLDALFGLISEIFARKGEDVINANRKCAESGFEHIKRYEQTVNKNKNISLCKYDLKSDEKKKVLITGAEAIALGAIASGIKFYSAYPMSPSTVIMEYLVSKQKEYGIIVEQAEDEISAVNMAIGAYFAGARAMTGTSGGGLALMVEGISLAGMTETPVVIVDGQRPAPATGLPTRTEQGDLLYVAHAGHGEFPRAILAPSSAEEAFYITQKAFYLAEKYQTPVFILADQHLNDSSWTVEEFAVDGKYTEKQSMVSDETLKNIPPYGYKRYEVTETGITPRIIPGTQNQVLYADSDEHTEEGHITESAEVRKSMVDKRLKKAKGLAEEISLPKIYSDEKADAYIICWGTNFGAVREAVGLLKEKNVNIGYIHFSEVFPLRREMFPDEIINKSELISVENNATGQFAKLIRMETGIDIKKKILKYDGRPFSPQEIIERINEVSG